jgi:hypothetical protein
MTRSPTFDLPVGWWSDEHTYVHRTLALPIDRTAFVLIDCDGRLDATAYDYHTKVHAIIPALHIARCIGMLIIYFHNAPGGEGGPQNINRELHGLREEKERLGLSGWKPIRPVYDEQLAPRDQDAEVLVQAFAGLKTSEV